VRNTLNEWLTARASWRVKCICPCLTVPARCLKANDYTKTDFRDLAHVPERTPILIVARKHRTCAILIDAATKIYCTAVAFFYEKYAILIDADTPS